MSSHLYVTKSEVHLFFLLLLTLGVSMIGKVGVLVVALVGIMLSLFDRCRVDHSMLRLLMIPVAIVFVGGIHALQNQFTTVLKDLYQYINPIIIITYGYFLARYVSLERFFSAVILSGSLLALFFLLSNDFGGIEQNSVQQLTNEVGKASLTVVVSLGALFLLKAYCIRIFSPQIFYTVVLVDLLAIFLSFSRTYWLLCILFAGAAYFSRRGLGVVRMLSVGIVVSSLVLAFFIAGSSVNQSRTTFMGKVVSSMQELTPSDYNSKADINSNWRGYEAFRGLLAYSRGGVDEWVLGHGLGKTADLGLTINLGERDFSEIYQFHNGYVNVLLKTGVVGVLLYLIFFGRMAWKGYFSSRAKNIHPRVKFSWSMIMVSGLVILITTFAVAGWLQKTGLISLVLIMGWLYGYLAQQRKRRILT